MDIGPGSRALMANCQDATESIEFTKSKPYLIVTICHRVPHDYLMTVTIDHKHQPITFPMIATQFSAIVRHNSQALITEMDGKKDGQTDGWTGLGTHLENKIHTPSTKYSSASRTGRN